MIRRRHPEDQHAARIRTNDGRKSYLAEHAKRFDETQPLIKTSTLLSVLSGATIVRVGSLAEDLVAGDRQKLGAVLHVKFYLSAELRR